VYALRTYFGTWDLTLGFERLPTLPAVEITIGAKPLADGSKAVGLFNRGDGANPVIVSFKSLGLHNTAAVRDLWASKDLGTFHDSFTANVPMHGVVLVKIK
jgi:alpha-galactosidase